MEHLKQHISHQFKKKKTNLKTLMHSDKLSILIETSI